MRLIGLVPFVLGTLVVLPVAMPPTPTASPSVIVARYNLYRTGVATDVGDIAAPVVLWTFQTNGTIATSPLSADLDGDGEVEIFFGEYKPSGAADGSRLGYVLDGHGSVEYTVPMRYNSGAAAAADLDGDGRLEVVFSEGSHYDEPGGLGYRVFNGEDGSPLWVFTTDSYGGEGFFGSPGIADLDGDGSLDLVSGSMDHVVYALGGSDGAVLWRSGLLEHYVRHSSPLADLDGDDRLEVVVHTEAGVVHVFDAVTGALDWEIDVGKVVAASPAVGDLDGDGELELVVSQVYEGGIVAFRGSGAILWQQTVHDFSYRGPTLVDVDGDGLPDVVEGDSSDPSVSAYRGLDGALLWERYFPAAWASGPLVSVDIDGDGAKEILVGTDDGLTSLAAATGKVEWDLALPRIRGEPLVSDVDGDGAAEILVGAGDGKLYVIGSAWDLPFAPRTIGYWKHQCTIVTPRGDHVGIQDKFLAVVRERSQVFVDLDSKAEACAILEGPEGNNMLARAKQQLLALWLNVASGFVDERAPVDLPSTTATSVGEAIAEVESILLGSPSRADLERAKDICDALNNWHR